MDPSFFITDEQKVELTLRGYSLSCQVERYRDESGLARKTNIWIVHKGPSTFRSFSSDEKAWAYAWSHYVNNVLQDDSY